MGAQAVADPLFGLPDPPRPGMAANPVQVVVGNPLSSVTNSLAIPDGCPGATQKTPSWESPQKCVFKGAGKYGGTAWVMSPGLYPGGLDLSDGTFYFKPGIYWIAGGGINIGGGGATARVLDNSGNLITRLAPGDPPPSGTHGVMFFNTDHPSVAWADAQFNGGFADFELLPLSFPESNPESTYNGLIFFNDRDYPTSPTAKSLTLNGGGSNFIARGTFYSPKGLVTVNGNSGTAEFTLDQAIAYNYSLNGNGGSIVAYNDNDYIYRLRAAGLVESDHPVLASSTVSSSRAVCRSRVVPHHPYLLPPGYLIGMSG